MSVGVSYFEEIAEFLVCIWLSFRSLIAQAGHPSLSGGGLKIRGSSGGVPGSVPAVADG